MCRGGNLIFMRQARPANIDARHGFLIMMRGMRRPVMSAPPHHRRPPRSHRSCNASLPSASFGSVTSRPRRFAAYRDTFPFLLRFAETRLKQPPALMHVEDLDAKLVLAFLDHLEQVRGDAVHKPQCAPRRRAVVTAAKVRVENKKTLTVVVGVNEPASDVIGGAVTDLPRRWVIDVNPANFNRQVRIGIRSSVPASVPKRGPRTTFRSQRQPRSQ
jgi:hypothetical protein